MKTKLIGEEKLLLSTHKSLRAMILDVILFAILGYMLVRIGAPFLYVLIGFLLLTIYKMLLIINWRIYVTSKRLITETGIFSQNLQETMIDKINHINSKKDFLGTLLNYGTVKIETSAGEGVVLDEIADVNGVKELLNSARSEIM